LKKTVLLFILTLFAFSSPAQKKKIQNQQYADFIKPYQFGFHVGLHTQDLILTNNGIAAPNGEIWFAEIPNYAPGFSVGVIGDLFLNPYMNLRVIPTIHFGDKTIVFREPATNEMKLISMRSNYFDVPINLKISSMRLNNCRPYILGGAYGSIELGQKLGLPLLMQNYDYGLEFGLGCRIYFPWFRFAPELKFKFGLPNIHNNVRDDLINEKDKIYTNALSKVTSRMIVFTFNFE